MIIICYACMKHQVTVVYNQPVSAVHVERPQQTDSRLGLGALIFAGITTAILLFCGCVFALPCGIIGVVLGVVVSCNEVT